MYLDSGLAQAQRHALVACARERPDVGAEVHALGTELAGERDEHSLGHAAADHQLAAAFA